jgi:hypothetical protein
MPTKTKMLEHGGFVHSPDAPMSAAFTEYLCRIDRLLSVRQDASEQLSRSPFSAELLERKKTAEREFNEFAAAYLDKHTIKHVEQDTTFMPVARFFARHRPVRRPFAILNCSLDMPLHTVYGFDDDRDLVSVNEALNEITPLRWWHDGLMNHPCYLFGEWIWELKQAELNASDKGLTLLFEQTTEQDRLRWDRMRSSLADLKPAPEQEKYIPETVRVTVWRRDGGKCIRCGGRDDLDFALTPSAVRVETVTAQHVQLLCARCREKK